LLSYIVFLVSFLASTHSVVLTRGGRHCLTQSHKVEAAADNIQRELEAAEPRVTLLVTPTKGTPQQQQQQQASAAGGVAVRIVPDNFIPVMTQV
jgi:hypothetical protein